MSSRLPWALVALLAVAQVGVTLFAVDRARRAHTTYVFTPLVDVVPGGAPLTAEEAAGLSVRSQLDARDMQTAYARMGSTMSLDDLLRGVEALEAEGRLTAGQRDRLRAILDETRASHRAAVDVQREILDLERDIAREVEATLLALPPDTRARVEARVAQGRR